MRTKNLDSWDSFVKEARELKRENPKAIICIGYHPMQEVKYEKKKNLLR